MSYLSINQYFLIENEPYYTHYMAHFYNKLGINLSLLFYERYIGSMSNTVFAPPNHSLLILAITYAIILIASEYPC